MAGLQKSEFEQYLKLTLSNKEILVFPNMEYQFVFYDAKYGTRRTVTGLVTKVYEDQIKIKVLDIKKDAVDCSECKNRNNCSKYQEIQTIKQNTAPMPTCNCVLNPPDISKYDGPTTYFIPVANIMSINYVKFNPEIPKPKGGTKVMLLGISATMVKAIIIHLEFFDDSIDNAVKYVDIQKDGIYNIAYEAKNGTIFEVYGKVHAINEVGGPPPRPHGPVRENVGFNNSVYIDGCDCNEHTKDDFMKEPPVKRVEIIIDASDDFSGSYERIMLDSIRDCTLVQAPEGVGNSSGMINPEDRCCDHCDKNKAKEYNYNNDTKVIVNGDKVDIFIKGQKTETDIDELIKYYLAI